MSRTDNRREWWLNIASKPWKRWTYRDEQYEATDPRYWGRARRERAALRRERLANTCRHSNGEWLDRSICPEPCGQMHWACNDCGRTVDECAHEATR